MLASCQRAATLTCHVHSYYCVGGVLYSRVTWWMKSVSFIFFQSFIQSKTFGVFRKTPFRQNCNKHQKTFVFLKDHPVVFSEQVLDGENWRSTKSSVLSELNIIRKSDKKMKTRLEIWINNINTMKYLNHELTSNTTSFLGPLESLKLSTPLIWIYLRIWLEDDCPIVQDWILCGFG